MRLFYALWPDTDTRAALQKMQAMVKGRLVPYANLHITLAFLGEQPADSLPTLKRILADLPKTDITLHIDRLGYFRRNHIAWAGSHDVPDNVVALQSTLAQALQDNGITFDNSKAFKPHVTLARDAQAPDELPFDVIHWHATQVVLVQSLASGGGVEYRVLASRDLLQPGA